MFYLPYMLLLYNFRPIKPMVLDLNYINLKKQVITAERRVLKELGFCVHVKHPHKVSRTYYVCLQVTNFRNEK